MLAGEQGQIELSEKLHRQHYDFAHKLIPYVVQDHFDELISNLINNSVQDWVIQLWNNCGDDAIFSYCTVVHPICNFTKLSDEIGLIYFIMPAPRVNPEAVYTAVVFLMDDDPPSDWLRSYFTLELGAYITPPIHWTLGEWDYQEELTHNNLGQFELEPTLENFLATVVSEARIRWG
ncbi:hypothetical protein B4U84_11730 [Westiellopsis prolifica IICB1]|nr:hypothetical protein B4U84_11730 [Westiellopsis prolifica IICB1]